MKISNIYNTQSIGNKIDSKEITESNDFKKFLLNSIDKLNTYESEANGLGIKLATGEIDNIHEVMISSQKADIALQFAIEIRNKVMDAYKEIMRMQI